MNRPSTSFAQTKDLNPQQSKKARRDSSLSTISNIVLTLSTIIAIGFLILLARQNAKLKRENAELRSTMLVYGGELSGPPAAQVGDVVPPFETVDLNGRPAKIVYNSSSKYVLFIFSPECGVCREQMPGWNRIAVKAKSMNYSTVGVSLRSVEITRERWKIDHNFDILMMPGKAVQRAYRIVAEPVVMLVSSQGRVDFVHYGSLSEDGIKELLSRL